MNSRFTPRILAAAVMTLTLTATNAVLANGEVDIPVVPASVMKGAPKPITPNASDRQAASSSDASQESTRNTNSSAHLSVTPGVNEIVPVAVGHLNRVVTPFSNPQVTTTSAATTEIRGNVVYIGTDQEAPVTMFITQQDSEAQAISLTLVPKRIPPRELFVEFESGGGFGYGMVDNQPAERWEESQPYTSTLRTLLRDVALGENPQGYTFHEADSRRSKLPVCQQSGFDFDFGNGQVMVGQNLTVSIGVAENTSGQPLEFREASCGNWDVAAVAAWPRNVLAPAEQTEIYVVTRQDRKEPETERRRPSLLGGDR